MTTKHRLLAASGMVVLALSLGGCVTAGAWGYDQGGPGYAYQDARRVAYDNGYRQGLENGRRDARSGHPANFHNDRAYREADWGYDRQMGPRDHYRRVFREGYEAGYREGYGRSLDRGPVVPFREGPGRDDRYVRPGDVGRDPAFRNGYEDGFEKGMSDARGGRSYDYLRHVWYREGDRHYNSRYGSRQEYKNVYRDGFKQGYEAGYQGRR